MAPLPVTRRPWRGGVTLAEWGVERRTRAAREAGAPAHRGATEAPGTLAPGSSLELPLPHPFPASTLLTGLPQRQSPLPYPSRGELRATASLPEVPGQTLFIAPRS